MTVRQHIDPQRFTRGLVRMQFKVGSEVKIREPKVVSRVSKKLVTTGAAQLQKARGKGNVNSRKKRRYVEVDL